MNTDDIEDGELSEYTIEMHERFAIGTSVRLTEKCRWFGLAGTTGVVKRIEPCRSGRDFWIEPPGANFRADEIELVE